MNNVLRRLTSFIRCGLIAFAVPSIAAPVEHVLIVSIDGASPSVIEQCEMRELKEMAEAGHTSWNAQTIFPSLTLPSHSSMLTGVIPEKHGLQWNEWSPNRGLVKVPTVFSLAHDQGLRTVMVASKEKFRHLDLPGSIDHLTILLDNAQAVARVAAAQIVKTKPHLTFVHFRDVDAAGHTSGWGSPQQKAAFAEVDAALAILRQSLRAAEMDRKTLIIVSADHGGHELTHGSNAPVDMTIPWVAYGLGKSVIQDRVTTFDTAATALWALGIEVPSSFDGRPVAGLVAGQALK